MPVGHAVDPSTWFQRYDSTARAECAPGSTAVHASECTPEPKASDIRSW